MLLQASAFFQDYYMVKKLCRTLGKRLLKGCPDVAAVTSSSDQQPATMQHIDQVHTAFHVLAHALYLDTLSFWVHCICLPAVAYRCGPSHAAALAEAQYCVSLEKHDL